MLPLAGRSTRSFFIGLLAIAACCMLASHPHARADRSANPFLGDLARLERQLIAAPDIGSRALVMEEIWRIVPHLDPSSVLPVFDRVARNTRVEPVLRAYSRTIHSSLLERTGDLERALTERRALGYVEDFQVVGAFDNEGKRGLETALGPEQQPLAARSGDDVYDGKERQVRWRLMSGVARRGYLSFDGFMRPNTNACAYIETAVRSDREQPLTVWIGAGGAFAAWWNGQEVLRDPKYRDANQDRSVAPVLARDGVNRLLIKSCVAEGEWGLFARVGAPDGGPIPTGVTFDAAHQSALSAAPGSAGIAPAVAAPRTPLVVLEQQAVAESPSASALEALARYFYYTGADDPADRRARDLALRALELEPTAARALLASELSDERGKQVEYADRALALDPRSVLAALRRADLRLSGPGAEDALRMLENVRATGSDAVRLGELRARVLASLGLVEAGLQTLESLLARSPDDCALLLDAAELADSAHHAERAFDLRTRALALQYDAFETRRLLIEDALTRDDRAAVEMHIGVLSQLYTSNTRALQYLAAFHEALGQTDEALSALDRAAEIGPDDATVLVARGKLLLRLHQSRQATAALQQALVLRPQDADTRELLEHIRPAARADETSAEPAERFLARRSAAAQYPATVLQDLTVNTVFDNGLGSTFRQIAVQIHDDEGARQWQSYSVRYDPGAQQVDLRKSRVFRGARSLEAVRTYERQTSEPWYRLYYDTRVVVVLFPDLEPGDVIELQYRVDDVAYRNKFADYYGDLRVIAEAIPVKHFEYVLRAPVSRPIYFNEAQLPSLRHQTVVEGATRVHRFEVDDVAPIQSEYGMPGPTSVAPYIHASTYQTWQDVGRWYWGLIADQLQLTDELRQTVAELVRDAPDTRTKVERIHEWVLRHTRYVGLEFGIHGYKPYRVALIVQRGFGDCKDKASLLYAFLREAGIDARIVLVRTRRNGEVAPAPASLAIFDHVIAFVPELNLYLDGTAERSGMTELPVEDQTALAVRVGPASAELVHIESRAAEETTMDVQTTARIDAQGAAALQVSERASGAAAADYRRRYEAEGTRVDRLEQAMASTVPGLSVSRFEAVSVSDLRQPAEIRWTGTAPQFARRDGNRLYVRAAFLSDLSRAMARTATRRFELDLRGTRVHREVRSLELATGARVVRRPPVGELSSPYGSYRLDLRGTGSTVELTTTFLLRRDRIVPSEYPAFRAWIEQVDARTREDLVAEVP